MPNDAAEQGIVYFKNAIVIFVVVALALFTMFLVMVGPASDVLTGLTYDKLQCGASKGGSTEDFEGVNCKCFGVMTSKHYESSKIERSCFGKCHDCKYPSDSEIENHFPEYIDHMSESGN